MYLPHVRDVKFRLEVGLAVGEEGQRVGGQNEIIYHYHNDDSIITILL